MPAPLDYQGALGKLLSLTDLERLAAQADQRPRYDLRRMDALLERLGSPHLGIPTVHITGTKGKGSTAAMVSRVLAAQGYRPGLFTSPHLHTFRERIRFMDEPVSPEEFASLVMDVWPQVEAINRSGTLGEVTTFELLTAMAFVHFRLRRAGSQVVEVGLGGKLDSTNLVKPQVCVITPISLDHTRLLGDTVGQIALDKAGIIKPGAVVVAAPQARAAMTVIERVCRELGVPLIAVERECRWARGAWELEGQAFTATTPWGSFSLWVPLLGGHQLENAVTALAALHALGERGLTVSGEAIEQGLRSARWPGRLEVLRRDPLLVADGAHNPYSAWKLREALDQYFSFRRLLYVVGVSADKDLGGMAQALAPGASLVLGTRSRHPRAAAPQVVAQAFRDRGVAAREAVDVGAAIEEALGEAAQGDLVVATGSLFVAAEAREKVLGIEPEMYASLRGGPPVP